MLNRYLIYLVILLAGTTGTFAYTSYNFYNKKIRAEILLETANKNTEIVQNNLDTKIKSCEIESQSVVIVEQEKKQLQYKIDNLQDEINKLALKGPLTKKPVLTSTNTEAPKNAETLNVLVGGELLDDSLRMLLQSAYCATEPDDSDCTSRQPTN
jgi:hypothetical protein